jgi:hypothetical protein
MTVSNKYLLDADSFIRAKRHHYGFDFCAGFWEGLLNAHAREKVASIVPVRKELLKGRDDLANWVKDETPASFFKDVKDVAVQSVLRRVSDWVMSHSQYTPPAKELFLKGADPWLIAYANVNGYVISSYEVASPDSKAECNRRSGAVFQPARARSGV